MVSCKDTGGNGCVVPQVHVGQLHAEIEALNRELALVSTECLDHILHLEMT